MEDDWDLQAVVRSCATKTTTSSAVSADSRRPLSSFPPRQDAKIPSFQDLLEPIITANVIEDSESLYKPFFPNKSNLFYPENIPNSPLFVLGGLQDLSQQEQHQKKPQRQQSPTLAGSMSRKSTSAISHASSSRFKKRKNNMKLKRVCHLPAGSLSSDVWSWRKYGQKPIKGSPYPRSYYKCSTSKGCLARKQVERNRYNPGIFIVTYTGEHSHPMPTHRNSLAGTTRLKPVTTDPSEPNKPSFSFPEASLSPVPENLDSSWEEREDMAEAEVKDDFFEGLDEFTGPVTGDCVSDNFPMVMQFPWLATNAIPPPEVTAVDLAESDT